MTAPVAKPIGVVGETRYLPTRVVIEDGVPRRIYYLALDQSLADPTTTPPQSGDRPRIFIAGPQRVPLHGPDTFDELELRSLAPSSASNVLDIKVSTCASSPP